MQPLNLVIYSNTDMNFMPTIHLYTLYTNITYSKDKQIGPAHTDPSTQHVSIEQQW